MLVVFDTSLDTSRGFEVVVGLKTNDDFVGGHHF
jgi:hypothetical protein